MKRRRISTWTASPLLLLCVALSILGLVYARLSSNPVIQALTVLISMAVVFFASHPLGHLLSARAFGVGTEYFFVGRSDFRKLPLKAVSLVGGLLPTVGTKLKKDELARLPARRRAYVFGAGVILSNALVGIELLYVLVAGFSLPTALLGAVFFVAMLATELLFSTKVGDLGKMRNEFKRQMPDRGVESHPP